MDGINFPIFSGDWFAPAIIALVGAIIAGVISQVAENKIPVGKAIVFLASIIGGALTIVLLWYNVVGEVFFLVAQDTRESKGCLAAFPVYKNAVRWNPKIPEARAELAECGLELNRNDETIKILEPLETLLSDSWAYWHQLAWAYFGEGLYDKMIYSVERSADLNPMKSTWIASLGEELINKFKYPEAEAVLRVARTRNGNDGESTFWLAWALYEQDKYDDALHHFDECIRLNPSGYKLYRCIAGKGFALRDLGRYNEAKSLLETALQMDPNQDDVKIALEQLAK